jgi:hypothetical protein
VSLNLPELRDALAARLATVEPATGQRRAQVERSIKSMITPPSLIVGYPESVERHHASMGESRWVMVIFGIGAAGAYDEAAQKQVDAWISDEGPSSVGAVLEAEVTLGGIAEDVTVFENTGYSVFTINGTAYLGTEWKVEILG